MKTLRLLHATIFICLLTSSLFAQKATNTQAGMTPKKENYTFFSNENNKLPYNAPCVSCEEDLEARTEFTRTFYGIDTDKGQVYSQAGYTPLHLKDNSGRWIDVDSRLKPLGNSVFAAKNQHTPVVIDLLRKNSSIQNILGVIQFNNNLELLWKTNNETVSLGNANMSNYTAGDDGVYVTDAWPGIDMEMRVLLGSVKTNFIIKNRLSQTNGELIIRDQIDLNNGLKLKLINNSISVESNSGQKAFNMSTCVGYDSKSGRANGTEIFDYQLNNNTLDIVVPLEVISKPGLVYPYVIDPLVNSSNTLPQSSILGSQYNTSCSFDNYCSYNLTVPTPVNATFTDILWNFDYIATGMCSMDDGALRIASGSCLSPSTSGYYWYCNNWLPGTCNGEDISIFSDLGSCLPAPSCTPQNVPFEMRFFRSCYGASGCSNDCIGAASPWAMTIVGRTIEYTAPTNPITLSTSTICEGSSLTATTSGIYGTAPYIYNWSTNATGTPSLGTGSSVSITPPGTGVVTIYSIVTDACGQQSVASRNITINPATDITVNYPANTYCLTGPNPIPVITPANGVGTFSGTGVTFVSTSTGEIDIAATGLGSYTVSFVSTGSCPANYSQNIIISNSLDANFTYASPICKNDIDPLPILTTGSNGVYSSSSTNLSLNTANGEIDLQNTQIGTYTITNVVPASGSCPSVTHSETITVFESPSAVLSGGANLCAGDPIPTVSIALTGNGPWDVGISDGTATTALTITSSPYVYSPTSGGNYTLTYVNDINCSGTVSGTANIVVNQFPVMNSVANIVTCVNSSVTVPGFTSDLTNTDYAWTNSLSAIGLGSAGNGDISSFTGTNTTSSPITGTIIVTPSVNGCVGATVSFTITINPATPPTAGTTTSYCFGDVMADLTATPSMGGTISWYNDPALTTPLWTGGIYGPSPNVGVHTYYVTETFSGCRSLPVIVTITVEPQPTVNAGADTTICENESLLLFGTGAQTYVWDNGVVDSVAFNPSVGTVTYTVTGTNAGGCSNTDQIVVNTLVSPSANLVATPITGYVPLTVNFDNNSTGGVSYEWDFGNGTNSTSPSSPLSSDYLSAGVYTAYLIVTNNDGCTDTAMVVINVSPFAPTTFVIPNVFTPGNDGVNDTYHFNVQNAKSFEATILNRWGNIVGKISGPNPQDGWDGKDSNSGAFCAEGVYFCEYKIVDSEGVETKGQTFFHIIYAK